MFITNYTLAVITAFIICLYIQLKLVKTNRRGIKFVIPAVLIFCVLIIWADNGFDVVKCLPITIIFLFYCFINLLITICYTLYQKGKKNI